MAKLTIWGRFDTGVYQVVVCDPGVEDLLPIDY